MSETIPALFARKAADLKDRPLFLVKREGSYQAISWESAAHSVECLAAYLLSQEVDRGDRVLMLSENRSEWAIADIAIQSIGAWMVPIYPSLTSNDIGIISEDCKPVVAIASTEEQAEKLLSVKSRVPTMRRILIMHGPSSDEGIVSFDEALNRGSDQLERLRDLLDRRIKNLKSNDTCTLIYTSGTTGEPKGVMLSHDNFLSNVEACLDVVPIGKDDLHLSFLPLAHVFERMAGWYLLIWAGGTIAYAENMDSVPQNMLEVRPTIMLGVPRFFEKLFARVQEGIRSAPGARRAVAHWAINVGKAHAAYQLKGKGIPPWIVLQRGIAGKLAFKKFHSRLGGRLRFFVSGSAPLSREIAEFFFSVGIMILEGYGLTETSPVITVNGPPVPRFGSVGKPISEVDVRIADDGEILTRGPHIMQGYYKKPKDTENVLKDGWFCTGDIGHIDEDGYLFITDRKKDLIKTAGGKFVAPQKLEGRFAMDPYVSQAFVYGDRERYCVALIVPNVEKIKQYAQGRSISTESLSTLLNDPEIREFYWCRIQESQKDLASFEQVKTLALLDQEFSEKTGELTPTLKAKRGIIAQRYEKLLRSLYDAP